ETGRSSTPGGRGPSGVCFVRKARASGMNAASILRESRIESVPEGVARQVEAHHRQDDRKARKRGEVRRAEDVSPPFGEHRAPLRHVRRGAEAEEAEAGGGEDRGG